MKEYGNISNVYFIGIGGIGMSALARYFLQSGAKVSGYDRAPSYITEKLEKEGAAIHFEDNVALIDKDAGLVVYTPAVPSSHSELIWYKEHQYNLKKRSEVLADLTKEGYNICIAGTHGKTTMSVMTAHLLRATGFGCQAFLGGISSNYETNYWSSDNNVNVIEADEYDRSFLKLRPDVALISAMSPDHLDIYGSVENMRNAFYEFAGLLDKDKGLLLTRYGLKIEGKEPAQRIRYSLQNSSADVYAQNVLMKEGEYLFDIQGQGWRLEDLHLKMGGMHNVENMVAAVAIANHLKIDRELIRKAVKEFKGVHRRFEYIIDRDEALTSENNVIYIDDYAHHPEELQALLQGARSLFNNRWITVIFQPHLYSRTRDLYKDFASALSIANTVILMPVYPARELPIEGITSEIIKNEIKRSRVMIKDADEIKTWLKNEYLPSLYKSMDGHVLITAGAGNIDKLVNPIKNILKGN